MHARAHTHKKASCHSSFIHTQHVHISLSLLVSAALHTRTRLVAPSVSSFLFCCLVWEQMWIKSDLRKDSQCLLQSIHSDKVGVISKLKDKN